MSDSPVHLAGKRSREAAVARDKEAWLAVFADDAIVEDPIGISPLDPAGKGRHGKDEIVAFYDTIVAPNPVRFQIIASYAAGDEVANVGSITTLFADGSRAIVDGVYTYRVDDDGLICALRAYWEFDAMRIESD